MAIKEPRKLVPTDKGHADVINAPIMTLYENDQELATQVESIKSDPGANGVASKEALDTHVANTELHVTAAKQAVWNKAQENAEQYTRDYAAPKAHTHLASDLPSATTQMRGITKLNNSVSSAATDEAATANAVKQAYDEAVAAKQLGVEQKINVVAALNSIGVAASTSESWVQLINKISAIIRATGSATVGQVLAGVPFSNLTGNGRIGAMPNRGAISQTITSQGGFVIVPEGYHNGSGTIAASFANLISSNVKEGVNIGGVNGTARAGEDPYTMPQFMVPAGATVDIPLPYDFNFLFIQPVAIPSDWAYITRVNIGGKTNLHGYTNSGTPINTSFPTPTTLRFNNSGNGNRWYDVTIIKRIY